MGRSCPRCVCCTNVRNRKRLLLAYPILHGRFLGSWFFLLGLRCFIKLTLTHGLSTLTDPFVLPKVGIDRGAIRFLLAGAHMMCPGMTSKGGWLPPADEAIPAERAVAIFAEGKEHPVGIGITKLSTEEMKKVNKNVGVETVHYLGDDLWSIQKL